MKNTHQSPYKYYTPSIREPIPLRRKPFNLPVPLEAPEKPQKINWLQTLLPPFIMLVVLVIIASVIQARGFFVYTAALMGIYPLTRLIAYTIQKRIYEKAEAERTAKYRLELEHAEREIVTYIRKQREFLKREFLPTENVCKLAFAQGDVRTLWYRTNSATDFLALRLGTFDGRPSFAIEVPKGEEIDVKDPLLSKAKELKKKYQVLEGIPYLLRLKELGSVAIIGDDMLRYGTARRLLLDVLVHHRPDEVDLFVLSNNPKASDLWGWLRWAPHCKVFDEDKMADEKRMLDEQKTLRHLIFGSQAVKMFLGRLEDTIHKEERGMHRLFVIDVNGIQQYDDNFISVMISKTLELNISLIFVGGNQLPRSVRGIVKFANNAKRPSCMFVDTRIDVKDKDEKEYHVLVDLDELPEISHCERVTRSLAGLKLLSSSGDVALSPNVTLFDVLRVEKKNKFTFEDVMKKWSNNGQEVRPFQDEELLQFPVGLAEKSSMLVPYYLNLLEARHGGKDAYHTMLIGTTGSGKSEFIKSLILGAAYKYPPQYLNFFCMDFKGGSTIEQLKELPHVIGVMTNLDGVLAQRGLVALNYEIDRRQAKLKKAAEVEKREVKDIWDFNNGKPIEERMPHLVLILDEFTRGLDLLDSPEYSLQDMLEKRLVPQGRSLGIYLILANQVVNAKVTKLLPNTGWRIALRVASDDQLQFIDSGLKPPKYVGRGYIQAIGEDPIEFQSGYSGKYVQYADLHVKPKNIGIKTLLPNGDARFLKEPTKNKENSDESSPFLEMNQVITGVLLAQKQMRIVSSPKIYLDPLPNFITMDELYVKDNIYRRFVGSEWSISRSDEYFLQVPIGYIDLVKKCEQKPLVLDFLEKNPHLLLAGSQSDILNGLRSILGSLFFSHTPDDVCVYMLEFGKGLNELPPYPHIADIIDEQDTEKVARTIQFIENELVEREKRSTTRNGKAVNFLPHLFLVINNMAGVIDNINLYKRILRLVTHSASKYGIHVILTALPKATGTRVSSSDLKLINSRIVFPSIKTEDYWNYFEVTERKLTKLTGRSLQQNNDDSTQEMISRAYWWCVNDIALVEPVELQIAQQVFQDQSGKDLANQMDKIKGYPRPSKIAILEKKYPLSKEVADNLNSLNVRLGIQSTNLSEFSLTLTSLPTIWGVSGPRESGKTNFLMLLIEQFSVSDIQYDVDVFAVFSNQLTEYCKYKKYIFNIGEALVLKRLKEIDAGEGDNGKNGKLLILDDINVYWERDTDVNKKIIGLLEKLSNNIYDKKNIMIVSSFNYSAPLKTAKSRDALIRNIHDNKTGMCLGYEGDWVINSTDLLNYKKNIKGAIPPGRGVFVLKGKETEIQAYWHNGE